MTPAQTAPAAASTSLRVTRRSALKAIGGAVLASVAVEGATRRRKKIIVAGGGIGGLCCAYELVRRGHDVTILEASNRPGGHVRSVHDPFPDGLYADLGAEQCTRPGYELWRGYAREFALTLVPYRRRDQFLRYINGKPYSEEALRKRETLSGFGFNDREVNFLTEHEWADLPLLFFGKHLDKFKDEYQPFGVGLDDLDDVSTYDYLKRENASETALRFIGSKGSSALHQLWHIAILNKRKVPLFPKELFRVKGGNQGMTDAFAARLKSQLKLSSPITRIEHRETGIVVHYRDGDEERKMEAEYLVSAIPLPVLNRIKVEPDWPPARRWIIENIHYNMQTRIVFQTRTRFWKQEGKSINISIGDPSLYDVWASATEVPGERGILLGSARPGTTGKQALDALKRYYPGKNVDVEHVLTQDWFRDPWAPLCERETFGVGQLKKFWPLIIQPEGRIHFVGAYADNLEWGMEAATRSANRVAKELDAG